MSQAVLAPTKINPTSIDPLPLETASLEPALNSTALPGKKRADLFPGSLPISDPRLSKWQEQAVLVPTLSEPARSQAAQNVQIASSFFQWVWDSRIVPMSGTIETAETLQIACRLWCSQTFGSWDRCVADYGKFLRSKDLSAATIHQHLDVLDGLREKFEIKSTANNYDLSQAPPEAPRITLPVPRPAIIPSRSSNLTPQPASHVPPRKSGDLSKNSQTAKTKASRIPSTLLPTSVATPPKPTEAQPYNARRPTAPTSVCAPIPERIPPDPLKLEAAWQKQRHLLELLGKSLGLDLETALGLGKTHISPTLISVNGKDKHVDRDIDRAVDEYYEALRDDPELRRLFFSRKLGASIFFRVTEDGKDFSVTPTLLQKEGYIHPHP